MQSADASHKQAEYLLDELWIVAGLFLGTGFSLCCVCVWAGRRLALDACYVAVFHGSEGVVLEKVLSSRVFAKAPHVFACFFAVFVY